MLKVMNFISLIIFIIILERKVNSNKVNEGAKVRALLAANHLKCDYLRYNGYFNFELLWQSGNTLETLSNYVSSGIYKEISIKNILDNTFEKTPVIVDNCYDDNQWWGIAWISAYEATKNISFLSRAASVFDYIIKNSWDNTICGGGLYWCPITNTSDGYKNEVTNELFLIMAMRLNKYEKLLNASSNYYLNWALKEWNWFIQTKLINSNYLINDGLDTSTCSNNNQNTWTYNQGILLDALGLLSNVTGDYKYTQIAEHIVYSTITLLTTSDGVLKEPCSGDNNCAGDAQIFKGVFVRHLSRFIPFMANETVKSKAISFLFTNA